MKLLVTGANGLLGQKLVLLLETDPGISCIATAKNPLTYRTKKSQFHSLDITKPEQTEKIIQGSKPDFVINTAAMTQVDRCETERKACWRANVTAVEYLVTACENTGSHLIHISTDFVFDGSRGPLDETSIPNPVNYYGESKLAGEEILKKSKIDWSILRTVLVYGVTPDMSRSNIVLWIKKSLEDKKTISVVNDQWRTPTLAEDLAMACYLAVKKKAKGIYHVSGSEMMTPYDIAIQTADHFKLDKLLVQTTDSNHFKQPARRPLKTGFIIDKAKKDLGYTPHTFKEGLLIVAEQLRAFGRQDQSGTGY